MVAVVVAALAIYGRAKIPAAARLKDPRRNERLVRSAMTASSLFPRKLTWAARLTSELLLFSNRYNAQQPLSREKWPELRDMPLRMVSCGCMHDIFDTLDASGQHA
jgi:hypothetical protein